MNWVKAKRKELERSNYVLKADASSNYWFGISHKKLDDYKIRFDLNFNIILYGSDNGEGDFYNLPFIAIKDLLTEENLYSFEGGRKRWVGDIRNHILRIRNSRVERNLAEFYSIPIINLHSAVSRKDNLNDYAIENAKREVQVRIKQSSFRKKVLENFDYKCCLTSVTENDLLVASHIIPWSDKIDTRLSPHNGLCLSVLYDRLFDKGFFTLNEQCQVIITRQVNHLSPYIQRSLRDIDGKSISTPGKYQISGECLKHHRDHIFDHFK